MSDRCPICGTPKRVLKGKFVSDIGSTDVYSVIEMGCMNDSEPTNGGKPCPAYALDVWKDWQDKGGTEPAPDIIEIVRNLV